jgi:murein L,D-transpeptidase YcbB/YkuD
MNRRIPGCTAAVLLTLFLAACHHVDNRQHADAVRALLDRTPPWVDQSALGKRLWKVERDFYTQRQFLPAWIDGDRPTPQMKELISQLHYSEKHGLDPATYRVQEFEDARARSQTRTEGTRFDVEAVPELDARLTYAYLRYAADLLGWSSTPQQIWKNWLDAPKKDDLAARLTRALADQQVRATLEELAPTHPQYKGLQEALAREKAHPDGHLEQIKMNLERWRWAPRDLGDRYILVNVPAYQLQVMEGDKPTLAMRVIVGAPDNPTPLFSDDMRYVVFSPYWNIPESILRKETLPRLVNDPDYLERNHIEVVGTSGNDVVDASSIDWSDEEAVEHLRFRQAPGDENALGLVKFIFPNHFNVYLHDTPTDRLFFKPRRALSHGCIRVEKPVALAEFVMSLDHPDWTPERIDAAMHANKEQTVSLKTPLPVHIGYWTAWVEPDGKTVTYTDDPYGIDQVQARVRAARTRGTAGSTARAAR